jgi:hypothetical protein
MRITNPKGHQAQKLKSISKPAAIGMTHLVCECK